MLLSPELSEFTAELQEEGAQPPRLDLSQTSACRTWSPENGEVKVPEMPGEATVRLISTLSHDHFVLLLCKCFKNNQREKKKKKKKCKCRVKALINTA